jgi:hypothetical protein
MLTRTIFGLIAMTLMALYLGPIVFKMKELSLGIVVLIGLTMMVVDFLGSLREKD